jgi:hypothetical protein
MTQLDPPVRDLLAAVVELEKATRGLADADRSTVFAYLGGLLGGVIGGTASMQGVTQVLAEGGWRLLSDPRQPARR